jgi:hypothetical protein
VERSARPSDPETAVRERYAAAAQAREEALCCPVEYDPRHLGVIPDEVLERDYGCGESASARFDVSPTRGASEARLLRDSRAGAIPTKSVREGIYPMCTPLLDGLDGAAEHIRQRLSLVAVAESPLARPRRAPVKARWDAGTPSA